MNKKPNRLFTRDLTVREIVARINTGEDFKALRREQKRVERQLERANEKTFDKLSEYSDRLTEVENLAQTKIDKIVDWDKVYGKN